MSDVVVGRFEDLVSRGLGRAARAMGRWCEAFRPAGPEMPLAPVRRFLRLQAVFAPVDGRFGQPVGYGEACWSGLFDSAYSRVGDYIRRDDGAIWFVASQQPMLPVLCVRTTRVVSLSRPAAALLPGADAYGGVRRSAAVPLLNSWPACVLDIRGDGLSARLPQDAGDGAWHVLLPVLPDGVLPRSGDLLADDLGRGGVVVTAEQSDLGWKLRVVQAAS